MYIIIIIIIRGLEDKEGKNSHKKVTIGPKRVDGARRLRE